MVQRPRYIAAFKDIPEERRPVPEAAVEERKKNFSEVELGYPQEQAVQEALRCLSCRKCLGCGLCAAVCHARAIDLSLKDSETEIEVDAVVIAPDMARGRLADRFGTDGCANVVDFLRFSEMLRDSGPYAGLVLRPADGDIPGKIAFVQAGSAPDEALFKCAVELAQRAGEKMPEAEIHLFFAAESGWRKSAFHLNPAGVTKITEDADSGLAVSAGAGEEHFDMVVLFDRLHLPQDVLNWLQQLGVAGGKDLAFLAGAATQEVAVDVSLLGDFKQSSKGG